MATEYSKAIVELDGKQAESVLKHLKAEAAKFKEELRKARKENDLHSVSKLQKEIKANTAAQKSFKQVSSQVNKELHIMNGMSFNKLKKAQSDIYRQLLNMKRVTKEDIALYKKRIAQYKQINAQMAAQKSAMLGQQGMFQKLARHFNYYFAAYTAFIMAFSGIILAIKEFVGYNADLTDAMADVRKTTGLTIESIRSLYSEFKRFNTRTPRMELLKLAEEAGRLGLKGKKDILDFVEAGNQIQVALGDDLGGEAAESIKQVGKLTTIFKVGQKYGAGFKEAMLMVGSSLNEVSANSQAQAGYLINFVKRLAGIGSQTDVGIDKVIGLGAALDELGQKTEMSATAVNKTFLKMFQEMPTYAKIAGMEVEEFNKLLQEDANEAFLTFLKGLNGNSEGLIVMSHKLDELGIDGARSVQVLAALASNTDLIRKHQNLANESLEKATSLTDEYNIKNETLAGNLSKIGRAIRGAFINSNISANIEKTVSNLAKFAKTDIAGELRDDRLEINRLVMRITSYNEGSQKRLDLIKQLKSEYPQYLGYLDAEKVSNQELLSALQATNTQLIRKIYIEGRKKILGELQEEAADKLSLEREANKTLEMEKLGFWTKMSDKQKETFTYDFDFLMKAYEDLYDGTVHGQMKISEFLDNNGLRSVIGPDDLATLNIMYNEWKDAWKLYYKAQMDAEKEMQSINQASDKWNLNDPNKKVIPYDPSLYEEPGGKKGKEEKTGLWKHDSWFDYMEWKRQTLEEYRKEELNDEEKQYTKLYLQRETAYNEQMEQLAGNKDAQAALTNQFQEQELEKEIEHITELTRLLNEQINSTQIATMDPYGDDGTLSLEDNMLSDEEYESLVKKYEELLAYIAKLKAELATLKAGDPADPDNPTPFGLDPEQWEGIMSYFSAAISTAQQLGAILDQAYYNQSMREREDLETFKRNQDHKERTLVKALQKRSISYEKYQNSLYAMDVELEEKEKALKNKEAKRQKKMAMFNAQLSMAGIIMNGLNTQPFMPLGIIMGALAAVLGGIQLGMIANEPVPQYYSGNKYEVLGQSDGKQYNASVSDGHSGIYHDPTLFPGLGLISDRGPELVFNNEDTSKIMNTPSLVDAIHGTIEPRSSSGTSWSRNSSFPDIGNSLNKLNDKLDKPFVAVLSADYNYIETHNEVMAKHSTLEKRTSS